MTSPNPFLCRPLAAWSIALAAGLAAPLASANDRPFQVVRTAVLDDDEQVWSFESWAQRLGSVRGLSVEPEYTFDDGFSIQVELTRLVDRRDRDTGHEAEVEFKKLFNDIARDGWGWGLGAVVAAERSQETRSTVASAGLRVPVSIALGQGGGLLHLTAGLSKARDSRFTWTSAAGVEHPILERTTAFAEVSRQGDATFMQVGVRHHVRGSGLALDFSLQRQHGEGGRGAGFIVGLGWYDL